MRELYDRLIEEGEAGIDRLIAVGMQESLQLDFKRKELDRNGEFSPNDRKMLAEALSGFANSAGGLLLIGVDARKGPDGIDCAREAKPISDVRRFLADANTEVGRLVQPRLDGVSVASIDSDRMPGSGYLLVHVARSGRRPHRSEAKNQKGYYKRVGDSFFEMEHYDIEDAFSMTSSPSLELKIYVEKIYTSGDTAEFAIKLYFKNTSDFIAKYPFISVDNMMGCTVSNMHSSYPFEMEKGFGSIVFTGGADDVVHPGMEKHATSLLVRFKKPPYSDWQNDFGASGRSAKFACTYGCEDGRALRVVTTLDPTAFGFMP